MPKPGKSAKEMAKSARESPTDVNVVAAVGTIVWVRRRNGSWWPGRIISNSELSRANLQTPRSGTPVQLLGRPDGSVDWYNIKKSKRVLPFRSKMFEDEIRKAMMESGVPRKKRESYARRSEAILHALQLEKLQPDADLMEPLNFRKDDEVSTGDRYERKRNTRRAPRKPKPKKKPETDSSESSQVYTDEDSSGIFQEEKEDKEEWSLDEEDTKEQEEDRELLGFLDADGGSFREQDNNNENLDMQKSCVTQNGGKLPSVIKKRKRTLTDDRRRDRRKPLQQVLQTTPRFYDSHLIDEAALVEGSHTMGMESLGVEFTSDLLHRAAAAERNCGSFSDKYTTEDAGSSDHKSGLFSRRSSDEGIYSTYEQRQRFEEESSEPEWVEVPVSEIENVKKPSVPMVLLTSRATNRRVIGYPVVVEPVDEDGFQADEDGFDSDMDGFQSDEDADENGFRSDDDGFEPDEDGFGSDVEEHFKVRKSFGRKNRQVRGRKKAVQPSRKTKTLSSMDTWNRSPVKQGRDEVKQEWDTWGTNGDSGEQEGDTWDEEQDTWSGGPEWRALNTGRIKQEQDMWNRGTANHGWPVPTCVPVRVALSRIMAALI